MISSMGHSFPNRACASECQRYCDAGLGYTVRGRSDSLAAGGHVGRLLGFRGPPAMNQCSGPEDTDTEVTTDH